jgi:hypothetical protein
MSPNFWGALSGVFWGALIVEINLSLFIYAIKNSKANKLDSPIWVTILKFYGLFALTVLLIIVVMFFRLGNPLWFLAGLLTFIPALFITILWGFLSVFLKHGFNGPLKP